MASPIRSPIDNQVSLLSEEIPPSQEKVSWQRDIFPIISDCLAGRSISSSDQKIMDRAIRSRDIRLLDMISKEIPEGKSLRIGPNDHTKQSLLVRIVEIAQDEGRSTRTPLFHLSLLEYVKEGEEIEVDHVTYKQKMDREALYAEAGLFAIQETPEEGRERANIKKSYELYATFNLEPKVIEINRKSPNILLSIRQVAIRGLEQFPELPILYALLGSTLSRSETIEWPAGSKQSHTRESLNLLARQKQTALQTPPPAKTGNPFSKITGWLSGKTQK